ncbi:MAG: 50S ribosomal protein L17 [Candidatus Nealsonbacteria bacterium]|nr:50S ribosomal protein L17 [Candidatus Nealsonbacteria bacterium]
MNKLKKGRKLSRQRDQRRALLKILATNLILRERIKTTRARAKETAPFVEKAITLAKKQSLNSHRALQRLFSERVVTKLIKELGPRYQQRQGGYSRILKLGPRSSDAAAMTIVELVK